MFSEVISLYRLSAKPTITNHVFSYKGPLTPELKLCLDQLGSKNNSGYFEDEPIYSGNNVEYSFRVPTDGNTGFYKDFPTFTEVSRALGKCQIPKNIYIIDDDWATCDDVRNSDYQNLLDIIELIESLSKLATTSDPNSSSTSYILFFSSPGEKEKTTKTYSIKTTITESIFKKNLKHKKLPTLLTSNTAEHKLNMEERKLIFCSAIIDNVPHNRKNQIELMDVLENWDNILDSYWVNLQSFVYGFSFAKIREDLARAELEYGSKLSSTFSDITGKLLALPISLVGLIALEKANSTSESIIIILGLIIVSIVAIGAIYNQKLSIRRITNGSNIIFDQFDKRALSHRKEIRKLFESAKIEIHKQQSFLNRMLFIFSIISLTPIIGAITISYIKWKDLISLATARIFEYISLLTSY